ncbi:MAG: hypothetical protein ACRYGP_02195 [Janthinobacterium lividum]
MPAHATDHQRRLLQSLFDLHGGNRTAICFAYARAEANGQVFRKRGNYRLSPEMNAEALLAHGLAQGWIEETPGARPSL